MAVFALIAVCLGLFALHLWERYQAIVREDAHRLQVTGLLQRIQAPEVAVAEAAKTERKKVPAIPYDDDHAFHEARKLMNGNGD